MLKRVTRADAWWGWLLMVVAMLAATGSDGAVLSPSKTTAQSKPSTMRGKALYETKCSACHSVDANSVGPLHKGLFGRRAGAVSEYEYSDALQNSGIVWNKVSLEKWLTDPEALIPGQKMGYRLSVPQERVDIVQYLSTLK